MRRFLGWEQGWNLIFFFLSNFSKLFNFSAIFVPVPFCQLVRIWSLFLSILFPSKYLQPNFEVRWVSGSLSLGLIPTVLLRHHSRDISLSHLFFRSEFFRNSGRNFWQKTILFGVLQFLRLQFRSEKQMIFQYHLNHGLSILLRFPLVLQLHSCVRAGIPKQHYLFTTKRQNNFLVKSQCSFC